MSEPQQQEQSYQNKRDQHMAESDEPDEPEGIRMTGLRRILEKSLLETIKSCNYNALEECFPLVAAADPYELRNAQEKVCEFLAVEVKTEFEQIIHERNLIHKLNGLDRLIEDARSKGQSAGSRTILDLSPEAAVRARVVPTKEAEVQRLRAELERIRLDNRRLGSILNQNKAEQTAIGMEIIDAYTEFKEVREIAARIPVGEMEQLVDRSIDHIHLA
ncbi:hypothetical protein BG004_003732 [Podila humilis]|nr:hypothetical protein BG004_003732 [Podila humilis]